MLWSLPSAFYRALGKKVVCRVPKKNSRQTINTRQINPLSETMALGKATLCRVPKSRHSANAPLLSAAWAALGNKCHVRHTSPHTPVVSPHTPVTTGPPLFFAECLTVCTRQRQSRAPHTTVTPLPPCCHECYTAKLSITVMICRVPGWGHSAKLSVPSASCPALGKALWMPSAIGLALGIETRCQVPTLALGEITKKISPMQSKLFS